MAFYKYQLPLDRPKNRFLMGSITAHCSLFIKKTIFILNFVSCNTLSLYKHRKYSMSMSIKCCFRMHIKNPNNHKLDIERRTYPNDHLFAFKTQTPYPASIFANHFCSLCMHACAVCRVACVVCRIPCNITQNTDSFLFSLKCRCYRRWSIGAMVGLGQAILGRVRENIFGY